MMAEKMWLGDTLLIEIALLRQRRRYSEILALTELVPQNLIVANPAFAIARAGSLSQLRRHGEALSILLESEPSIAGARDDSALARWQLLLAIQYIHAGKLSTATELLRALISSPEISSLPSILADSYNSLGVCLSFVGEVDQALLLFNRSMIAWQGLGDARGIAFSNQNIGLALREWGNARQAEPYLQRADSYYKSEGIIEERVNILAERSLLYSDLGDEHLSIRLARHATISSNATLSGVVRAAALRALGVVTSRFSSASQGEELLRAALNALGGESGGLLRGEILEELAVLAYVRDPTGADNRVEEALAAYREIGSARHCQRLLSRINPDPQVRR